MKVIKSQVELNEQLKLNKKNFALLYKAGSESSECAVKNLEIAAEQAKDIGFLTVNVAEVKNVHANYNVKSVPTLLEFQEGDLRNIIKGCQDSNYLKAYFDNTIFTAKSAENEQKSHNVTVYTTPTCSWCNTLKSYLNKNSIRFNEIDISKDQKAADEMVRRSGQQGVPQSVIDGQTVIGFDQKKIDQLLEIE